MFWLDIANQPHFRLSERDRIPEWRFDSSLSFLNATSVRLRLNLVKLKLYLTEALAFVYCHAFALFICFFRVYSVGARYE
jgi:hypothetical protein